MNKSRIKYRRMASATRRAANRYFKRSMRSFGPDSNINCKDLVRMFKRDLRDLRNFAKLVNQGQLAKAYRAIERMDTAVYEEIPTSTYNYVNNLAYKRWCDE